MNGSDRLRERAQRVREIRREALLGFGVGEEHDLGGQFITELADLAADLGDALRIARPAVQHMLKQTDYDTDLERMVPMYPDMERRLQRIDAALARLDAWGQE